MVEIDHGDGLVTKYMHHDKIYVEEGQKVEKRAADRAVRHDRQIYAGNHLHFQVEEGGWQSIPACKPGVLATRLRFFRNQPSPEELLL